MKITTLGLLILMLSSFNSYAGYEVIKIKLLNMTIPAEIDDHGKFGLATPDFELSFRFSCGGHIFNNIRFDLPSNNTKMAITHKVKSINIVLKPSEMRECLRSGTSMIEIEEEELIGSDNYLRMAVDEILFERELVDSPLKIGSTIIKTMREGGGEADSTFLGLGKRKNFSAQVEFKSVWIEE
jgi:hypothetical protein